jgi:DNA replication protein DnaC
MFALLARLHRECGTLFRAVRAVDLKARVLELARSDSAELAVYVEGLRAVPVLFVDDLAQAAMSAVYGEKLFDLVEHRTVRGLPCLFTVQIGPTDLERKLAGYEGLHADRAACLVRRIREFCRSVDFGA